MVEEKIAVRPCGILIENGKVLCILSQYKEGKFYLFPGGGVEYGESIEECVMREVLEETGIKVKIKKLVYINDRLKERKTNTRVLNLFFTVERVDKKESEKETRDDGGKIKKVEWIDLNKFEKIDFRPKLIAERLKKDYENGFKESIFFTTFI